MSRAVMNVIFTEISEQLGSRFFIENTNNLVYDMLYIKRQGRLVNRMFRTVSDESRGVYVFINVCEPDVIKLVYWRDGNTDFFTGPLRQIGAVMVDSEWLLSDPDFSVDKIVSRVRLVVDRKEC